MNDFFSNPEAIQPSASSSFGTLLKSFILILTGVMLIWVALPYFPFLTNNTVTAYFTNIFTRHPKVDVVVDHHKPPPPPPAPKPEKNTSFPEITFQKQVFNIPDNTYDYANAKALCSAYGAELATLDQVQHAYEKGAEWCNYGWSDGQMALFPTQRKSFEKLQKIPGHEHDCGRPGVNGGFIANPNSLFGVNCFGNKPKIDSAEQELMKNVSPYPQSKEDAELEKKIEYWKSHLNEILVSPFNYEHWGQSILG